MLERFEQPLRILCLALGAVLVFQFARLVLRGDPLAHLNIPELPTLASATNSATTNVVKPVPPATNAPDTNKTQKLVAIATTPATNTPATNNLQSTNLATGTNRLPATNTTNPVAVQTNTAPTAQAASPKPGPPNLMPGLMMAGGPPKVDLPPAIQTRVDKITESEILGPVVHPQPLALIGIAGDEAYIRTTTGQTGPVKVGGELGGVKLLRIGLNRVVIESKGEQSELTLFGGLGSETLLPKTPSSTNLPPNPKENH